MESKKYDVCTGSGSVRNRICRSFSGGNNSLQFSCSVYEGTKFYYG